jgi:hypothetical protein
MLMIESTDPKVTGRTAARCSECDRVKTHYNEWLSPAGETSVICWQCLERAEKGFNAKRNFHRGARTGVIPR